MKRHSQKTGPTSGGLTEDPPSALLGPDGWMAPQGNGQRWVSLCRSIAAEGANVVDGCCLQGSLPWLPVGASDTGCWATSTFLGQIQQGKVYAVTICLFKDLPGT